MTTPLGDQVVSGSPAGVRRATAKADTFPLVTAPPAIRMRPSAWSASAWPWLLPVPASRRTTPALPKPADGFPPGPSLATRSRRALAAPVPSPAASTLPSASRRTACSAEVGIVVVPPVPNAVSTAPAAVKLDTVPLTAAVTNEPSARTATPW